MRIEETNFGYQILYNFYNADVHVLHIKTEIASDKKKTKKNKTRTFLLCGNVVLLRAELGVKSTVVTGCAVH